MQEIGWGPAYYAYFLPIIIMLCSSAQIFDLLCSILRSCKLKNLTVLLEYIHLYKNLMR